ncbi:bile acid:sodium symporter family protein [Pseudoalteromonas luteoviolacea]|uniref:Na+-dependent transporter n=1 Tax=Pseudoalteromonas luteoviolacea S4054 TaxID=1129367 RepID=A0A0F6A3V0_9GAMM|nr:bile acid:sodium symporter family protein [Pseudoalteromonas luteoviolacea]AOT08928.1 Na+-dependent transporter [Pseudoalteromonas luteoviolacea]AOT13840.1 Na+-dependent transporter [Pseudoalteromonas luteoviolacea]AOT18755.1 Na+-dependent transporter [Pseudoalteromonas luteoviolacea]KKE80872.1 Na+-dependent transporter [Pseudoalteromonas luteoviolacea S4054]KZN70994.1 Na+-dependent transporter [Pseudoalteromonas luteoviolacea S4047-1]
MPPALIEIGLPVALIFIMAGVGLSLKLADFQRVYLQPKSFFIGAFCQLLLLPVLAIVVIALTGLTGELAIGLFILALCPGGTTSNLYSYLAKGDVGLSVSLTAVVGFITPFTLPFLAAWAIGYYGKNDTLIEFPILKAWLQLIVVGVVPVLIGMAINTKWPEFAKKASPYISWFSVAVLLLVIVSICFKLGDKLIDYLIMAGPAVILLNLLSMVAGLLVAHFLLHNATQTRTITLEVGLQNGTLALLVTTGLLSSEVMSIAPSIYGLFMFISAGLYTAWAIKKA